MNTAIPYRLTLVSHRLCPYVQRAVIALEELGIAYQRVDVDLDQPSEWFTRLSPLGKVPLLKIDDEVVLFESAVIAEFANDIGGGELLASDPVERARQRAWIEFASATLDNIGAFYSAGDEESFARHAAELQTRWDQLEQNLSAGPFFSGAKLSLVDAAYGPVFRYLDLFEQLLELEFLGEYPKVATWRKTLAARESVRNAVKPDYTLWLAGFISARNSYLGQRARAWIARRSAA